MEPRTGALALQLLRLIVASGRADSFKLMDVAPRHASRFQVALAALVEAGQVDCIPEAVGRWHYSLTATGREAATKKTLKKVKRKPAARERPEGQSKHPAHHKGSRGKW